MSERFNVRLLDLLADAAQELVERLGADASAVSRVIGDVLILVSECTPGGRTLQMGQGYLVPDYPLTQEVLSSRLPRTLTLADPDVDAAEASVLEELGFASLLLMPLDLAGQPWGLVEVYRTAPQPFGDDDVQEATAILTRTSARAG